MKRKTLLTLAIGAILTFGSVGSAFAAEAVDTTADTTFARGNGLRLYASAASVEDLLNQKLALIDKMVADGKITAEEAEGYKKVITERMDDCTTIGENRDSNERLGIGFGSGSYLGQGQGLKAGTGFRGARGMGFGRIAAE